MLSTARKAPSSAPPTAIEVFSGTATSAARSCVVAIAGSSRSAWARAVAPVAGEGAMISLIGRVGVDRRLDRHPRVQPAGQRIILIESDLDRDALDDLGEVASSVVGRQQRELLAAGGRQAFNMAADGRSGGGVDRERGRLGRA